MLYINWYTIKNIVGVTLVYIITSAFINSSVAFWAMAVYLIMFITPVHLRKEVEIHERVVDSDNSYRRINQEEFKYAMDIYLMDKQYEERGKQEIAKINSNKLSGMKMEVSQGFLVSQGYIVTEDKKICAGYFHSFDAKEEVMYLGSKKTNISSELSEARESYKNLSTEYLQRICDRHNGEVAERDHIKPVT